MVQVVLASATGAVPALASTVSRSVEMLPVVVLLFLAIFMTVKAEPVMRYMQATATALHDPTIYVRGVLGQTPLGQTPLGWSDAGGAAPGTEGETTP